MKKEGKYGTNGGNGGYSKKQTVSDKPNPNRGGKKRPLIDYHGKNVRRGK